MKTWVHSDNKTLIVEAKTLTKEKHLNTLLLVEKMVRWGHLGNANKYRLQSSFHDV